MNIDIRMVGADKESAYFKATVADAKGKAREYRVSVRQKFWRAISRGRFSPAELVARTMRFLSKQPQAVSHIKDQNRFDLSDIAALFPNFASKIRTAY